LLFLHISQPSSSDLEIFVNDYCYNEDMRPHQNQLHPRRL
jgi:hypothetical protein